MRSSRLASALCRAGKLTGAAVVSVVAAVAACGGATAVEARALHRDWEVVRLPGGAGCAVAQAVIGRRTGVVLAQLFLQPGPERGATLIARVPNGVHLPDGLAYRHSGAARTAVGLAWQSCDAERCSASGLLSRAELGRLLRGREIILGYRPMRGSAALNVPVSLMGLSAAWTAALGCNRTGP